jgi:Zn-dependent peptidase ImmA (M78 family)/transcriptional regulator with XRE-family HTH domain
VGTAYNHAMFVIARELRGLTQTELAKRLNVAQGAVSKIENGVQPPSYDLMPVYARELDLPVSFFQQTMDARALPVHFWRKKARVTATQGRCVEARMNVLRMQMRTLVRAIDVPENRVPILDPNVFRGSAEDAARLVRERWMVARGPIPNMTKLLEDHGVVIVPCDLGTNDIDGMSVFVGADTLPPIILINPHAPGDRLRWSLAHELGHLVLHTHHNYVPKEGTEDEADAFASEFSMPEADIRPHLRIVTLDRIATLKLTWKMSMGSIIKRAMTLGLVGERWTRTLWMNMSQRGWRMTEPNPIPRDEPTLIGEMISFHKTDLGYGEQQLADALHMSVAEMRATLLREPTHGTLRRIK